MYQLLENYIRLVFENEENKRQKFIDILNSFTPETTDQENNPEQDTNQENEPEQETRQEDKLDILSSPNDNWIENYRLNISN